MLNKDIKKNEMYKSYIEKLLPEPQPISEPLLRAMHKPYKKVKNKL
jgi:hypothetical protein